MTEKRLTGEQRREVILQSAMVMFTKNVPNGASTRDISSEAGISVAMLYKHFPNKEALYLALADYVCGRALSLGEAVLKEKLDVKTFMRNVYLLMFFTRFGSTEKKEDMEYLAKLILQGLINDDKLPAQLFETKVGPWVAQQRGLELLQAENALYQDHSSFYNKLWMAQLLSFSLLSFSLPKENLPICFEGDQYQVFDQAVLFSLRGLAIKDEVIQKYYQPKEFWKYIRSNMFEGSEKWN